MDIIISRLGIPDSRALVFLKLLEYIEKIIKSFYPSFLKWIKFQIWKYITKYFPNGSQKLQKVQRKINFLAYSDVIVYRVLCVMCKSDVPIIEVISGDVNIIGTSYEYLCNREFTRYETGVKYSNYEKLRGVTLYGWPSSVNNEAKEIITLLREMSNISYVYEYENTFKIVKQINIQNIIPLDDWDVKVGHIQYIVNQPQGPVTFICNGDPGVGKSSFAAYLAYKMQLSLYVHNFCFKKVCFKKVLAQLQICCHKTAPNSRSLRKIGCAN